MLWQSSSFGSAVPEAAQRGVGHPHYHHHVPTAAAHLRACWNASHNRKSPSKAQTTARTPADRSAALCPPQLPPAGAACTRAPQTKWLLNSDALLYYAGVALRTERWPRGLHKKLAGRGKSVACERAAWGAAPRTSPAQGTVYSAPRLCSPRGVLPPSKNAAQSQQEEFSRQPARPASTGDAPGSATRTMVHQDKGQGAGGGAGIALSEEGHHPSGVHARLCINYAQSRQEGGVKAKISRHKPAWCLSLSVSKGQTPGPPSLVVLGRSSSPCSS